MMLIMHQLKRNITVSKLVHHLHKNEISKKKYNQSQSLHDRLSFLDNLQKAL